MRKMSINTLIYTVLCIAVTAVTLTFALQFFRHILPHWWANGATGLLTFVCISPFMRALVMKNNRSEEFKELWTESRLNRLPLVFTVLFRVTIAAAILFYVCNYLARFTNAIVITLAVTLIFLMVLSRRLKKSSISMERRFIANLRSREVKAQVEGKRKPLFEKNLVERDIHISDVDVPTDSSWAGKTLGELRLSSRFGVYVSSILRGHKRINIPGGYTIIFPNDRLQAIGNDEQLKVFAHAIRTDVEAEDTQIELREMKLQKVKLGKDSPFIGRTLKESGIREQYNCMVVGVEEGQDSLTCMNPNRKFAAGDIIWVVGEKESIKSLPDT